MLPLLAHRFRNADLRLAEWPPWRGTRLDLPTATTSAHVEPEGSFSETNTYLGATAHWNRFYADLLVQPDFIQHGPNFVSGYSNNLFTRVSLKYDFNQ